MEYLKTRQIDICGKNGEYHTLVINGPIFKRKIRVIESKIIAKDNYWFLDTVNYKLSH